MEYLNYLSCLHKYHVSTIRIYTQQQIVILIFEYLKLQNDIGIFFKTSTKYYIIDKNQAKVMQSGILSAPPPRKNKEFQDRVVVVHYLRHPATITTCMHIGRDLNGLAAQTALSILKID